MPGPAPQGNATSAATTPDDAQPWLDDEQQRVWRHWLALAAQLPSALNRQLQADSDLSLQDFDVLVQLSEVPSGRSRASALAEALQWERSRLSHHVRRMEARGLVEREDCEEDRRGAFVQVTRAGRAAIAAAAPDHAALVRRVVFDGVSHEELAVVEGFLARALKQVSRDQDPLRLPEGRRGPRLTPPG
jgi:DNA-binding MarR family transcriptional regulator